MIAYIDTILATDVAPHEPGAAVAVVKDGAVLHCKGYGRANLEWDVAIAPDTVFPLGELAMPFTATCVMLLHEQGTLHVDAPLTTYLPDFPATNPPITLYHLLTHTSGLDENFDRFDPRQDWTPDDVYAVIKEVLLRVPPGSAGWSGWFSGYFLLQRIIERVSGRSFEDVLQSHIFAPLGMTSSCYLRHATITPRRASGYSATPEFVYQNAPYVDVTHPWAGGPIGSTAQDLARWASALQQGRLLSPALLERMYTRVTIATGATANYGCGWMIGEWAGRRVVYHPGHISGFRTAIYHLPDDRLTVILLSNFMYFDEEFPWRKISRLVLGVPLPERRSVTLNETAVARVAGTYTGRGITFDFVRSGRGVTGYWRTPLHKCWRRGRVFVSLDERSFFSEEDPESGIEFDDERGGTFTTFRFVNVLEPMEPYVATRVPEA
jgi:CubicO group peptidase (beta-lactamase class C family)